MRDLNFSRLNRNFFQTDPVSLAKKLLGKILVRVICNEIISGKIVEVESYLGVNDPACHAYKGKVTNRNKVLYEEAGKAYIYSVYKNYLCFNIVANKKGIPGAVFIRAVEPLEGIDLMKKFRNVNDIKNLCNGPAKLCQAFNITKEFYGEDLTQSKRLFLIKGEDILPNMIVKRKRINIDYAGRAKDWLLRFYIKGNRFISKR